MKWCDVAGLALKNALRGRNKTFLCALAVCVGIASVYIMCEISFNAQQQITDQIEKSGMGGIMVFAEGGDKAQLKADDIRALPESVPQLKAAMPIFSKYGTFKLRNQKGNMMLWGVDEQLAEIFNVQLLHGRLPSAEDVRECAKVAVVEETLALKAYQRENVVGKHITLTLDSMRESYEIIGVITSQKSGINALIGGDKLPTFVYVPYTTSNLYTGMQSTGQMALSCETGSDAEAATAFALQQLAHQNPDVKFSAENISGYVDTFSSILQTVSALVTLIGGISLLVGGIGVMNSMIAAIESRKKEIGIYLAIGAQKKDIIGCYLLEAVIICLMGGLAGGTIGSGLLYVGARLIDMPFQFHFEYLLLAEIAAALCGVLFGILPAYRASKMSPIAAIRSE